MEGRGTMAESKAKSDGLGGFSRKELLHFLRQMLLYRRFEEKAEEAYAIGKIGGFCHLHVGQEGVAAGSILPLREDDYAISAYREHTQALAKGLPPEVVMAELYGKAAGASGGMGGSMHMFGANKGFMGGHGIVGAQTALALGIAWAIKYRGQDRVCVCFIGDAAVNQGAFHESLNMAAIWQLPVVYVVENNDYGMGTKFSRVSQTPIADKSAVYGIPATIVNGQDVIETYRTLSELYEKVRSGGGPQFVDAQTYRFKGHSMSDPVSGTYRSKEEVAEKREHDDPITILKDRLVAAELLTQTELEAMDAEVRQEAQAAVDFAEASPEPDRATLHEHVYSEINPNGRLFFDGRDRGTDV